VPRAFARPGHFIFGPSGPSGFNGVFNVGSNDTVENGYIEGFSVGVAMGRSGKVATKLQVNGTSNDGIDVRGTNNQSTSNTLAENSTTGLFNSGGVGNTLKGNHLLNNGQYGLDREGSGSQISGNIANGNAKDRIVVIDRLATLTGNTANYNSALGINATSPQIDGGTNAAKGNTTQAHCRAVVCS
jgi:hypothetical protein